MGGTSLAPASVPGQFDDATSSSAASVTTYDEFGRPKPAVSGRNSNGNSNSSSSHKKNGMGGDTGDGGDTGRDRDRDRDRLAFYLFISSFCVGKCVMIFFPRLSKAGDELVRTVAICSRGVVSCLIYPESRL